MQISITFRHVDSNEEIKNYAKEKLQRLEKYVDAPLEIQVICTQEKHRHRVEVLMRADGLSIAGQEETADFLSSIDAVVDNLERQLKKQKKKFKQHKDSNEDRAWRFRMDVTAAEDPDESTEPQIIASRNVFAKPMSLEEAVMQMKLTDNEFIVFTDSSNEKVSVLYRRKDGNFGLIEPEVR
jgi:putative sigma-54 modulation protein